MKFLRLVIIFGALVILAFLLHLGIYKTQFSIETISNVTFVVGIISFLPSLIAVTGAHQIFQGIGYVFKTMLSKSAKEEFPTFKDYKEHKSEKVDNSFFKEVFIMSFALLVIGIILAVIVMMQM